MAHTYTHARTYVRAYAFKDARTHARTHNYTLGGREPYGNSISVHGLCISSPACVTMVGMPLVALHVNVALLLGLYGYVIVRTTPLRPFVI